MEWVKFVFNMGLNISRVKFFYLLADELYDHTSNPMENTFDKLQCLNSFS